MLGLCVGVGAGTAWGPTAGDPGSAGHLCHLLASRVGLWTPIQEPGLPGAKAYSAHGQTREGRVYSGRGQRAGGIHARLRDEPSPQLDLAETWGAPRLQPGSSRLAATQGPRGGKASGGSGVSDGLRLSGFSL